VVLGVTGGIAAYKAADLASKLTQAGAIVDVILTESARQFVGEATFEALTQRPVHTSVFAHWRAGEHGHVTLAKEADVVLVAPATANSIAKLANGLADDMLGAVALSSSAPLLIAPAMEHAMFHHPATQANLRLLKERGAVQIGPLSGHLASGEHGDGRFVSTETLLGELRRTLGRNGPLKNRRVVVTAGGTQEALDPVRYIGNRSSGQMGYALAQAAIDAGACVTLVTGPTHLPAPVGATVVSTVTALEMRAAVQRAAAHADALIGAAAVADYRPAEAKRTKMKKEPGQEQLTLQLVRNPDILGETNRGGLIKIGFAAETEELIAYAREKLVNKGLALIVANDAEATIGSPTSEATLISADGSLTALPRQPKAQVAAEVIARLADLIADRNG
jgi:phosphopantothenoylcysteine decarboxylase/phosphopantothenate--cysteine ligase